MKERKPENGKKLRDCKEIQAVLFDYMSRELGKGQSDLISRHLKKCKDCQAQAAEIQATIDFLRRTSQGDEDLPTRLSDERRDRLFWSITHPILDWMARHHIVVSLVIAFVALVAVLAWSCRTRKMVPIKSYEVYIFRPEMTNRSFWLPDQPLPNKEEEGVEVPPPTE